MNDRHNGTAFALAAMTTEITAIIAAEVLAQRLVRLAAWRREVDARREGKALVQEVDAWLAGGAA